jgi:hypothetical protein
MRPHPSWPGVRNWLCFEDSRRDSGHHCVFVCAKLFEFFLLPKPCLPHAGVQSFECLTYIDESYLGKHVYISARRTVLLSGDNLLPMRKPEMSSWEKPEVTGKERRSKMHVFGTSSGVMRLRLSWLGVRKWLFFDHCRRRDSGHHCVFVCTRPFDGFFCGHHFLPHGLSKVSMSYIDESYLSKHVYLSV